MREAAADNGVDTTQFVRGMGFAEEKEQESDSTGMWERHHASFLTLFTEGQGAPMLHYTGIHGGGQGGKGDAEWFVFTFHGDIDIGDGEGFNLGRYRVRIVGRKLESIVRHVRSGRRTTIRVSGFVEDAEKPMVTSIRIERLEDE